MRTKIHLFAAAMMTTLFLQGSHAYVAEAALPRKGFIVDTPATSAFKEAYRNSLPVADMVKPYKKDPRRLGIELTAPSAVVVDVETGRVLFSKNANDRRTLASLTKLMTALVFMDLRLDPKQEITLAEEDRQTEGRYYFEPGDTFERGELLRAALGVSSNNGIAALVRTSGLSRETFVSRMNAKAKELGIDAEFVEPTGLNPRNRSSALGVEKMLRAAMQYPEIRGATTTPEFDIQSKDGKKYHVLATDELLGTFLDKSPYAIIGGKTGYIDEAGFCLAQTVRRAGHEVDIVVLGATANELRFQEVKSLAVWTFEVFSWE